MQPSIRYIKSIYKEWIYILNTNHGYGETLTAFARLRPEPLCYRNRKLNSVVGSKKLSSAGYFSISILFRIPN